MNNNLKKNKKSGFTLAEVLITLGIIGVVAAMTIPVLISSTQKQETETGLKAAFSLINQILLQAANDNTGGDFGTLFSYDQTSTSVPYQTVVSNFIQKNIAPYASITKDCGIVSYRSCTGTDEYYLNGIRNDEYGMYTYKFYLKNGEIWGLIPDNDGTYWQGMIFVVDINGNRGPNMVGKDVFEMRFFSSSGKIGFWGLGRSDLKTSGSYGCNKLASTSQAGGFCGALIQQNGWVIPNDYPW